MIGSILKKNDIAIYESTVFPGATEDYCVPILEKFSKLKYNIDFYCGYSPERINPGDKEHTLTKITKIVSGSSLEITNFIENLYGKIITAGVYKAKSIKIAEAAKVIENIQRDVNIALINELSMVFDKMDIDTMEVLRAAETKWNFLPFRPGLVGGHCIGVDPYYLTHKSLELGYNPEMILAGRKINEQMSEFIVDKTISEMTKSNIKPENSTIGVFGLSFKENCPDLRNSKSVELINLLKNKNCNVLVSDPVVKKEEAESIYGIDLIDINDFVKIDTLILTVPHNYYMKLSKEYWINLFKSKGLIIDVKSALKREFFINSSISHWRL
jgi:UDP-N-acetyl-D-galactosamine dehydrogenase